MRKQDFQFELPDSLIASQPCKERTQSRLLVLQPENKAWQDSQFLNLIDYLEPNDCLVFNNTKVIPARLVGQRDSGGKVEVLLERFEINPDCADLEQEICVAQLRASNAPKADTKIQIAEDFILQVIGRDENFFKLANLSDGSLGDLFEKYGSMPLPPYIQRKAEALDDERYQTVYAEKLGAVAAPTAGLHFDESLMQRIKDKGIEYDFLTLHVGAGTFSPMRVDDISEHKMHSERYEIAESVVELIKQTKAKGGRVVAVGTTSVRCLESAAGFDDSGSNKLKATQGETDIFIYPGYQFKVVDALITNFHLSESTLLMLVSAFAGKDFMLSAYKHAVEFEYRFFSYGDAMFIQNRMEQKSQSEGKINEI